MSTDLKSHSHGNVLPGSAGRLSGIDFSSNNFKKMTVSEALAKFKKDIEGQRFSFVKATQGTDYKNEFFKSQWNYLGDQIKQGKMDLRVAYSFLNAGNAADGEKQAKAFLAEVGVHGKLPAGTRLALDWEQGALKTPEVLKGAADYIHKVTGTWPIVYTSSSNEPVARQMVPGAPRWEANYGLTDRGIDDEGGKILPSKSDTFDQYSDGKAYGLSYDMNVFNGTEAALRKFAGFDSKSVSHKGLTPTGKRDNAEIESALKHGPISEGATGPAVKALNRLLGILGFDTGSNASQFGPQTATAMQEFQAAEGLKANGVLDKQTFSQMVNVETRVREEPGTVGVGQMSTQAAMVERDLTALGYERSSGDGVLSKTDTAALKHFERDDKLHVSGSTLTPSVEAALSRDVKALNHSPYRTRVVPSKEHTRLDTDTAKEVAKTETGIGLGSRGQTVSDIQSHLLAAGFNPGKTAGDFDDRTVGAVEAFQRESGLPVTGRVDAKAWADLEKSFMYTKSPTNPPQSLDERSSAVLQTQRLLRELGYAKVAGNSLFGKDTEEAVVAFQKKQHLDPTGQVGKATLDALEKAVQKLVPKEPKLQFGSRGPAVRKLQELLIKAGFKTGGVDGHFGEQTLAALMDYQYSRGLHLDGVANEKTWRALFTDEGVVNKPPKHGTIANLIARAYLGDNEETVNGVTGLEYSGRLPMDTWVPPYVDCANFVSACLQVAGKLPASQHSDNVKGLKKNLLHDGWKLVPLKDAKPGDVVCFDGPEGPLQHVELFNAWVKGKPQYIGSNNIQANGDQTICTDDGSYFDGYKKYVLQPPA
jgi:peptidoglycan hydrolase-like protein with peptidoglycan-binding domain/GH25 family lysozyme M1 (1,4-beta-N-acetylmuramidase)